jgi:carbamoyltransferase
VQDIAASAQKITEEYLVELAQWARKKTGLSDLVLSGGVALNCVANTRIARESGFDRIWIMPNPGDAGSSLGAVAAYQRKKLEWQGPYLGHDVSGILPIEPVIQALLQGEVVGIVHGRAEFGPRALGHRSLLLDPRLLDGKDRMNRVKGREPFRPFAPAVLSEHASEHFDMPVCETAYMQYVVPVLERGRFPAIEHVDGTARVQTVSGSESPDFRRLLEAWYATTGCPMLLNTSLNVKGEPLVNDIEDAARFARVTGVKVITP